MHNHADIFIDGDSSKVKIDDGVKTGKFLKILQSGENEIQILGESAIGDNVRLSTGKHSSGSGNKVVINGNTIITNGSNISITQSGSTISIQDGNSGFGIVLKNVNIEDNCIIEGANIYLQDVRLKSGSHIKLIGSGKVHISSSEVGGNIICNGSGDVDISNSTVQGEIQSSGSGDLEVSEDSIVSDSLTLSGSGDMEIRSSTIKKSLSVVGSSDLSYTNTILESR